MKPNKMTRARSALIQSQRFYGSLALGLTTHERTNIETLATDGRSLFYNPQWLEDTPMPEVIGVTAKLVTQLALLHHTRRGSRDKDKWKQACDLAVNPLVITAGFELPAGYLNDPAMHGKSAEEIYRLLPEPEPNESGGKQSPGQGDESSAAQGGEDEPPTGDEGDDESTSGDDPSSSSDESDTADAGADPGKAGQVLDATTEDGDQPTPAEAKQIEADMATSATQARTLAKQAGQGTDMSDRLVELLKTAQQDWREDLRHFLLHKAKDDYSWSRPSRRFISRGLYLPSLHSTKMGELVVAVDVSGSVWDWIEDFMANLKAIHADVRPTKLHIVYCADQIAGVDTFEPDDVFEPKVRGAGGTSFIPVFDWIAREGIDPACLIYLTDMYGEAPKDAPDFPVLWAVTSDEKAPWGERTQMRR